MSSIDNIHTIRLSLRSYDSNSYAHQHSYHQVVLPRAGQLQLQCGQHTGQAAAACAALIPAGESHCYSARGENAFWVLDVPVDAAHDALFDAALDAPFLTLPAAAQAQLQYAALEPALQQDCTLQHHWSQLLLSGLQRQSSATPAVAHKRLQLALNTLPHQLHLPLDILALAKAAHLSSSQLHRLFQRELSCTPQQWMSGLRMRRAAELLQSGHALAQTAQHCGYADQSSFGKAFKRFYGRSPGTWLKARASHQKKPVRD